jgi:hypothetical protein
MEQVISNLYVGGDKDVPEAKKRGYARLAATKDGIDSHRSMLGYTGRSAPKGDEYLYARRGDVMALNLIDVDDPEMIPWEMLEAGIKFVAEMLQAGKKILVHCNAGHSRGPTTAFMAMRAIGELPQPFNRARHIFKTLYEPFSPGHGMEVKAREHWLELENKYADHSGTVIENGKGQS